MAKICITLLTYDRFDYARVTLQSALENIVNIDSHNDYCVHIASDGDTQEYIDTLHSLAVEYVGPENVTVTNSERGGYGKNYNLAMQVVHQLCDVVLPLEDDWELKRDLPVNELIAPLLDGTFGCVRMGYIGFTQPIRGEFVNYNGKHWLLLDTNSPEPHVFAGHPRFESVQWARSVGPWREDLLPGETEFEVAHREAARKAVAWPIWLIKPQGNYFVHIGARRSY